MPSSTAAAPPSADAAGAAPTIIAPPAAAEASLPLAPLPAKALAAEMAVMTAVADAGGGAW